VYDDGRDAGRGASSAKALDLFAGERPGPPPARVARKDLHSVAAEFPGFQEGFVQTAGDGRVDAYARPGGAVCGQLRGGVVRRQADGLRSALNALDARGGVGGGVVVVRPRAVICASASCGAALHPGGAPLVATGLDPVLHQRPVPFSTSSMTRRILPPRILSISSSE
jgi:hypothetical protein